jgi:hypothetical protein
MGKDPPAEPEALRLLAPQRGLIATGESKSKNKSKGLAVQTSLTQPWQNEGEHTPGTVKLLLPPRQSRGISLCIRVLRQKQAQSSGADTVFSSQSRTKVEK